MNGRVPRHDGGILSHDCALAGPFRLLKTLLGPGPLRLVQRACDERLLLIHELTRAAEERLAVAHRLDAELRRIQGSP